MGYSRERGVRSTAVCALDVIVIMDKLPLIHVAGSPMGGVGRVMWVGGGD